MTAITTSLVIIAILLGLHGIGISVFCWLLFVELRKRDKLAKEANFHFAEISKNLGGKPFIGALPESIETKVVINDLWDDERQGRD